MSAPDLPDAYRACVGMMVANHAGDILVGKRIDSRAEAWQMPQGGIDEGEDPQRAALRELQEEIGTNKVSIIARSRTWLHYDLPAELVPQLWGGKFRGQKQQWFLMRFEGESSDINLNTEHPEFSHVKWVKPNMLPALIVPFKRALYTQIVEEFAPLL